MISGLFLSQTIHFPTKKKQSLFLKIFQKKEKKHSIFQNWKFYISNKNFNFSSKFFIFFSVFAYRFCSLSWFLWGQKIGFLFRKHCSWTLSFCGSTLREYQKAQIELNFPDIATSENTNLSFFIQVSIGNLLLVQEYSIEESLVLCLASELSEKC